MKLAQILEARYASPRTISFTGDFYAGVEGQYWEPNTTIVLKCGKETRHGSMTTRRCSVEEVSGDELATEMVHKNANVNLRLFDEGGWEIMGFARAEHKNKYGDSWTMLHPDIKVKLQRHRAYSGEQQTQVRHRLREARYAFIKRTLEDFDVGDMILLLYRTNRGDDIRAGRVIAVNHNDLGLVTYGPDYGIDKIKTTLSAGQGAFDPTDLGKNRFGLVDVKVVQKAKRKKKSHPV